MGVPLKIEVIPSKLVRTSATTVQLPASVSLPAVLRIGGFFKVITSPLLCNLSTVGFGGLDAGVLTQFTVLNFFAVLNGGAVGLVASLSDSLPNGFPAARKLGSFNVNHVPEVGGLLTDHDGRKQLIQVRAQTSGTFTFGGPVYRRVIYDQNIIDTHRILSLLTNWRVTLPITDKYRFIQSSCIQDTAVGFSSYYESAVFLNQSADDVGGSGLLRYQREGWAVGQPFPALLLSTDSIPISQSSFVDFRLYQNSGSARVMVSDNALNYCEIERPGDI